MKYKVFLPFLLISLLSSCENKDVDDKYLAIEYASNLLTSSSEARVFCIINESNNTEESDAYWTYYYNNNYTGLSIWRYYSDIDESISKLQDDGELTEDEIMDLKREKSRILLQMKEKSFFDTSDRVFLRDSVFLKAPNNRMFFFPDLASGSKEKQIEMLYFEKLNISCLYYHFASFWYPIAKDAKKK